MRTFGLFYAWVRWVLDRGERVEWDDADRP